jgi:hypothetical protein
LDTRGDNAVRHHNSVLHGLLKSIPWAQFEALVDEHGADARVRRLSTKAQLVAMLYGQLSGAASLREIETGLQSHASRLYHLGATPAARSTLADANRVRPHQVFSRLFDLMAPMAGRGFRKDAGEAVRLIDSTYVHLAPLASRWACLTAEFAAVKAHVLFDPDAERPLYLQVTKSNVNDITVAHEMPIEKGATYVFDLGYYHYAWWAKLHDAGCRIVSRLKTNTRLRITAEQPLPQGSTLLYDRIGLLPERLAFTRNNPFSDPLREIGVELDGGKQLRLVTNDLDAPAEEIADLYKRRWAIELFFRWVKQTLKIKHFLGESENAVRIQIAVALIAYLILKLAKDAAKVSHSLLTFSRLVKVNLMHRRAYDQLLGPPPDLRHDPRQLALDLAPA